jgi:hypothetical protein
MIAESQEIQGVTARVFPIYFPLEYDSAQRAWEHFEVNEGGYEAYLLGLSAQIEECLSTHTVVLLAPMRVAEIVAWAGGLGLDAADLSSRVEYLRQCPPEQLYSIGEVSEIFDIIRADALAVLRTTSLRAIAKNEVDSLEFIQAGVLADEQAENLYRNLVATFESSHLEVARIFYIARGWWGAESVEMQGWLEVQYLQGELAVSSKAGNDVLVGLLRLGPIGQVRLHVLREEQATEGSIRRVLFGFDASSSGWVSVSMDDLSRTVLLGSDGESLEHDDEVRDTLHGPDREVDPPAA